MTTNMKYLIYGLIAIIIAFLVLRLFMPHAGATGKNYDNVPGHECEHGVHLYNPHCQPSPTATPSATPTPTEEPKCWEGEFPVDCPIETPTPTDVPVRTDLSDGLPSDAGATQAHINLCNGIFPDKPVIIEANYKHLSDTSASFDFWGVKSDRYLVQYGYSKDNLPYGIEGGLPGDSSPVVRGFELDNLKPGFSTLFARVTAKLGECYTSSEVAN